MIELLTVIGIISVLAALLLPVLSRARSKAQTITCAGNLKQLHTAWVLYADDNRDRLAQNNGSANWPLYSGNWVWGVMSYESDPEDAGHWYHSDSTNTMLMVQDKRSQLGSYLRAAAILKCPADQSWIQLGSSRYPRVRSYSLSDRFGYEGTGVSYFELTKARRPGNALVFLEQHEDSIQDPAYCLVIYATDTWTWPVPANRHGRGVCLSFADGHVERHGWRDSFANVPVTHRRLDGLNIRGSADGKWLAQRSGEPP